MLPMIAVATCVAAIVACTEGGGSVGTLGAGATCQSNEECASNVCDPSGTPSASGTGEPETPPGGTGEPPPPPTATGTGTGTGMRPSLPSGASGMNPFESASNVKPLGTCTAPEESSSSSSSSSGSSGPECTTDSDCRSRQRCPSGRCVTVECTSDRHCGCCSRSSNNVCRSCGSGPYGCYC